MKKHVLSVLVLVSVAVAVSAQTEQGNFLVGGNLNFNSAKEDRNITIAPSAGYFFIDNFAAGANVLLSFDKEKLKRTTEVEIGPFARYYFGTMNIRPFAHANIGFTTEKTKTSGLPSGPSATGSNYFLGGGLAAFINRNVALEGLLGYRHTSFKNTAGSGGVNLRVGFQVYLSKRQVERLTQ